MMRNRMMAGVFTAAVLSGAGLFAAEEAKPKPGDDISDISKAGLELIAGAKTTLKAGDVISFFGDSITMQGAGANGYIGRIEAALKDGAGTRALGIKLFKHGLNGGRVPTVLEGKSPWGDLKAPMQELVDKEKPTVLVIFLGVNDVEHGVKGTTKEDYEAGLKKMLEMGKKAGAAVVLCTPGTVGEKKLGTNRCDKGLDEYAEIVRKVAAENKLAFCNIRKAMFDYLKEKNADDKPKGILTYDGIHMTAKGNALIADVVSKGIVEGCAGRK